MSIAPMSEGAAIIHMIERLARDPSIEASKIRELLAIKIEVQDREARLAFDAAFAEMQPELPVIDQKGIHGGTSSSYAKWEDIIEAVTPVLGNHGFSFRCRIKQESGKVAITGKLSHRGGFFEETTIELPIDSTGQKNAVQAIGSSISYGQRYVAKAMLGLSSRKSDDDNGDAAVGGRKGFITQEQADSLRDLLEASGAPRAPFLKWAKVARVEDIQAKYFDSCINAIKNFQGNKS